MATCVTPSELFQNRVESLTVRRLLAAGVEAFWRDGFHASSTRDIARRAQLSPAAMYVGTPTELLTRLVHAYVALPARMYKASLVANREFNALTMPQRRQVVRIRDELVDIVGNCLAAGKASGEFAFEDLSIARMAVVSLCRSTLLWYSPRGKFTPDELGDQYVNLVLGMVGGKVVARAPDAAVPRLSAAVN